MTTELDRSLDDEPGDPMVAVVAHGLLNSMAIIAGAASTLREAWDALDARRRAELLAMIGDQAQHVSDMLGDLARGLPPGVLRQLDELTGGHMHGEGGSRY